MMEEEQQRRMMEEQQRRMMEEQQRRMMEERMPMPPYDPRMPMPPYDPRMPMPPYDPRTGGIGTPIDDLPPLPPTDIGYDPRPPMMPPVMPPMMPPMDDRMPPVMPPMMPPCESMPPMDDRMLSSDPASNDACRNARGPTAYVHALKACSKVCRLPIRGWGHCLLRQMRRGSWLTEAWSNIFKTVAARRALPLLELLARDNCRSP
jgi:hypothetical protein